MPATRTEVLPLLVVVNLGEQSWLGCFSLEVDTHVCYGAILLLRSWKQAVGRLCLGAAFVLCVCCCHCRRTWKWPPHECLLFLSVAAMKPLCQCEEGSARGWQ